VLISSIIIHLLEGIPSLHGSGWFHPSRSSALRPRHCNLSPRSVVAYSSCVKETLPLSTSVANSRSRCLQSWDLFISPRVWACHELVVVQIHHVCMGSRLRMDIRRWRLNREEVLLSICRHHEVHNVFSCQE
jgi:hypothetical protein